LSFTVRKMNLTATSLMINAYKFVHTKFTNFIIAEINRCRDNLQITTEAMF